MKKKLFGISLAVIAYLLIVVAGLIPVSGDLPVTARNMLCVVIMIIILLVTEAFPFAISCLLGMSLMYFMGCVGSMTEVFSGFTNKTLFFVLASFGISKALTVVPVSKRLLIFLMGKCGKSINLLLLGVMCCVALMSSVISNVATCAVFVPIICQFLRVYPNEEEQKRSGRTFMIAIPVASMIGGMATPAGSSLNVLVINMLEKNTGLTISFVKWMALGIPLTVVILPIAWLIFIKIYKPAPLSSEDIGRYVDSLSVDIPAQFSFKEGYVIFVLLLTLVLWIASSWITILDIVAVAIISLLLYFLPGKLNVLSWKDYVDSISIEAYMVFGCMICIGNGVSNTGLSAWIAGVVFPKSYPASLALVIAFVAVLTFLLLIPIPVAPAVITMLSGSLCVWCSGLGVAVAPVLAAFGMICNNCYLLPLDTVPLISYQTGYYELIDMPKGTVWIQICLVFICSAWMAFAGGLIL